MNRISQQYAERYIKGGRATVVFHNTESGNQSRFTILQSDNKDAWFVFQYDVKGWILRMDQSNDLYANPKIGPDTPEKVLAVKIFTWVWKRIILHTVPDAIHILHMGYCSVCGRLLTDAESISVGIGPVCRKSLSSH